MPSVYDLKPRFQALLRPAMRAAAGWGFTPNAITILALAGSLAVGSAIALVGPRRAALAALPVWLFLRMALNAVDGMMARELGMATRLGGVLNEVGDVVSDVALYVPLARVCPGAAPWAVAFALGAVLTEFCGVLGPALGAPRRYDGPMGKSDRAFVVGAMALAHAAFPAASAAWPWVLGAGSVLEAATCGNRLRRIVA